MPTFTVEELVGRVIGPYRIEAITGHGGMAVVYRATQESIARPVALKVLRPEFAVDGTFVERLIAEARRTAALEHPNIAAVYDAGTADGLYFIAMRYIEGYSLKDLLAKRKKLGLEETLRILRPACSAVNCAHSKGTVHRDLKPSNILIESSSGKVFVVDFGISKSMEEAPSDLTRDGIVGTPGYLAPEQITGGKITPATDVFVLGILAYEMLTGAKPFDAETQTGVMYKTVHEQPTSPGGRNRVLSKHADQAIMKALSKNPKDRFGTALEFVRALAGESRPTPPPSVIIRVCRRTGLLPNGNCTAVVRRKFMSGREPHGKCDCDARPEDATTSRVRVRRWLLTVLLATLVLAFWQLWPKPPPPSQRSTWRMQYDTAQSDYDSGRYTDALRNVDSAQQAAPKPKPQKINHLRESITRALACEKALGIARELVKTGKKADAGKALDKAKQAAADLHNAVLDGQIAEVGKSIAGMPKPGPVTPVRPPRPGRRNRGGGHSGGSGRHPPTGYTGAEPPPVSRSTRGTSSPDDGPPPPTRH